MKLSGLIRNTMTSEDELVQRTAEVTAAFIRNGIPANEIPALIRSVYGSLKAVAQDGTRPAPQAPKPAVPIKRSVTATYIVCLEDGRRLKTLKRYLRTQYHLTPDQYRAKWGLLADYPMVAPNYAAVRSELAKKNGLGTQRRRKRA